MNYLVHTVENHLKTNKPNNRGFFNERWHNRNNKTKMDLLGNEWPRGLFQHHARGNAGYRMSMDQLLAMGNVANKRYNPDVVVNFRYGPGRDLSYAVLLVKNKPANAAAGAHWPIILASTQMLAYLPEAFCIVQSGANIHAYKVTAVHGPTYALNEVQITQYVCRTTTHV